MKLLTRAEELLLLIIWQLKEDAYSIPIREKISELSGEDWSLGSIYMPLDRLSKRGFVKSSLSESTPERGGRQKRIYQVTKDGKEALLQVRNIENAIWEEAKGLLSGSK